MSDRQPPPKSKGGKMLSLINWRLKITLNDGRALTGQMLAFDKHMNLVLAECEEFRRVRAKKKAGEEGPAPEQEIKRTLGLVILRGESVVSLSVEGPPPVVDEEKKTAGVSVDLSFSYAFLLTSSMNLVNAYLLTSPLYFALDSSGTWPWNACWTRHGYDASECVLSRLSKVDEKRLTW